MIATERPVGKRARTMATLFRGFLTAIGEQIIGRVARRGFDQGDVLYLALTLHHPNLHQENFAWFSVASEEAQRHQGF